MPLHFKGIALTLKMNDRVSSSSSPVAGIITREGSLIATPAGVSQLIITFPEILSQINR